MHFLGFNDTWIKWISGCLSTATSSILINGSLTREFNINRGLRQGDPLSLFLFIIAMEGLHVALEDAIAAGVPINEVSHAALVTGCNAMQTPFYNLGLPIDCNMSIVKSWDPIVDKFSRRLSKWKSSMLSIGGRATLISSVLGSIGTYYLSLFPIPTTVNKNLESMRSHFFWGSDDKSKKISWISWNLFLACKENGGLGIGSLYSLNQAIMQKWRWRFFNNPNSLWVRLFISIHGIIYDALFFHSHIRSQGVWGRIVGSISSLHDKGGANASNVTNLFSQLANFSLNDSDDVWSWEIGTSTFTVIHTREYIDQRILPNDGLKTRWNRLLPKKINIFIWRSIYGKDDDVVMKDLWRRCVGRKDLCWRFGCCRICVGKKMNVCSGGA
nr:RNA-directed DNA polymerase, eukaryota, reverse transcriptase zinc-binding domain protein [Tanacetum cinerariifolium]